MTGQRSNYCRHGNYIGTPLGADYLCGLCEDGADILVELPCWELVVIDEDGDRVQQPLNRTYDKAKVSEWQTGPLMSGWPDRFVINETTYRTWVTEDDIVEMKELGYPATIIN